ncbi:hypothetical protein [Actinokineospora iranica]|uniref:hypothetical protein n=1 Tax=Actinokineospora iranica TaxID=1271860 RepID=UPI001E511524|nr:hypothetical protein [Actinokineospora iranica]
METVRGWRELAEAENLSIRDLAIEVTARQTFVGSPQTVADTIDDLVQRDAADGFILVPHIVPAGLTISWAPSSRCCRNARFPHGLHRHDMRDHLGLDSVETLRH